MTAVNTPTLARRVVILGARGFVGRALQTYLQKMSCPTLALSSQDLDLTAVDAGVKLAALLQPDDALFFASAITPDKGKDNLAFSRNLAMAQQVSQALTIQPVLQVIYISSDAVYAEDIPVITDQTAAAPTTLYGIMHLAREKMVAGVIAPKSTAYGVLRPCAIYGPGDTHNGYGPNRFVKSARNEGVIKLFGQGEETRPHLFIDDFIATIAAVLANPLQGELTVAPRASHSFRKIAQLVQQIIHPATKIECLPRSGAPSHKHFYSHRLSQLMADYRHVALSTGLTFFKQS